MLGRGGFGEVYSAIIDFGVYAAKVIPVDTEALPRKEAKIMALT